MGVLVIGEALVDVVEGRAHVGGSPLNVSVGLARLGRPTRLLTRYGADDAGRLIDARLRENQVEVVHGMDADPTSSARVTLDAAGVPSYDFDIRWRLDDCSADRVLDSRTRVVHTGSIATVLQPGADTVRDIVRSARAGALVTFDPNCRPSVVPDRALAVAHAEAFVALSDVVKASDEDLAWLYPMRSLEGTMRAWLELGATLVVATRGGEGACATTAELSVEVPGIAVEVADTVGAGDSFMAALIDALLDRASAGDAVAAALEDLTSRELGSILTQCARAAAITVSRPGADPPRRHELDAHKEAAVSR
ncbi:MAG: carbohydrate kinase family protein [Protaetiibacter sp.]